VPAVRFLPDEEVVGAADGQKAGTRVLWEVAGKVA
jgi:hypothetical protein